MPRGSRSALQGQWHEVKPKRLATAFGVLRLVAAFESGDKSPHPTFRLTSCHCPARLNRRSPQLLRPPFAPGYAGAKQEAARDCGRPNGRMGLACANPLVAVAELDPAYASAPVEGSTLLQVLGRIPHGAVVDRVDAQTAIIAPAVQVSQLRAAARL